MQNDDYKKNRDHYSDKRRKKEKKEEENVRGHRRPISPRLLRPDGA